MHIYLPDIKRQKGLPIDVLLESSLEDILGDSHESGQVEASFNVSTAGNEIILNGKIEVQTITECSRCLESFNLLYYIDVNEVFTMETGDKSKESTPHSLALESAETLTVNGDYLYLKEYIRQVIILERGNSNLCADYCKGICAGCGKNLNITPCDCGHKEDEIDERFLKLKDLYSDN